MVFQQAILRTFEIHNQLNIKKFVKDLLQYIEKTKTKLIHNSMLKIINHEISFKITFVLRLSSLLADSFVNSTLQQAAIPVIPPLEVRSS